MGEFNMAIKEKQLDSTFTGSLIRENGSNAFTGNQSMGNYKLTNLATPDIGSDAATKAYVDSIAAGVGTEWREPVTTSNLIGNRTIAQLNALSPSAGDTYVATDAGTPTAGASDPLVAGSMTEFDGTSWIELEAGSGGYVADGVRAILSETVALVSPYTDGTDDGKIVQFDGTSLTGTDQAENTSGSVAMVDNSESINLGKEYAYLSGSWTQINGLGVITATNGVQKSGDTLSLDLLSSGGLKLVGVEVGVEPGDFAGAGLEDDGSDNLRIASGAAGNGLTGGSGSALSVDPDSETGGNTQPVSVTANGVGLDVSAIAGSGLEADGSANLRIAAAAAGSGLAGGAGSALSVNATNGVEVSGDNVQLNLLASGGLKIVGVEVGVEPGDFAGTGLEDDGSDNLRIATSAAGNGLTGGGGSALSVDPDSETGGNIEPVNVSANGVGLNVGNIAGTGLEADGSANLRLATQGTGISGGNGSVLSINTASTVTFSGATWTFPTDNLQITGTPNTANDAANKAYVDSQITGITWKDPVVANILGNVQVTGLLGSEDYTTINGLSPSTGDAYVLEDSGTLTLGSLSVSTGDIVQYNGSAWIIAIANSGGYPPAAAYGLMADSGTFVGSNFSEYSYGELVDFDGSTLYGSSTTMVAGYAYVIGDNDTITTSEINEGDIVEWSGSAWQTLVTASGGYVPAGTRALSGIDYPFTLLSPYVDGTDDGKVWEFSGSSNDPTSGSSTGDASAGNALLFQDDSHVGYYDALGFVFEGTVPTGTWTQFTGAGQINAGAGLSKSGNTINIGDDDRGVQVNVNSVEIDASEIASTGLEQSTNSWQIRLAAQGNGISGGAGSTLSVNADSTTGGNIQPVNVVANGVGVDVSAIAGNGLQADGSANLDVLANGTSVSVGASGIKAAVPTSANKEQQSANTSGDGSSTGITISATPAGDGMVIVSLNGVQTVLGNGVKTKDCYFSADGGTTARAIGDIASGDTLYWNGLVTGFDLDTNDYIDLNYNVIV